MSALNKQRNDRRKNAPAPAPRRAPRAKQAAHVEASESQLEGAEARASHDPDRDAQAHADMVAEGGAQVEMHGDTPMHPASHQPGTPGFVERRGEAVNRGRRASDTAQAAPTPALDPSALAKVVERMVAGAISTALHRAVPAAVRKAVEGDHTPAQRTLVPNDGPSDITTALHTEGEQAVIRNGVRCPEYGTVTGSLWLLFAKSGAATTLSQAKQLAKDGGYSETSAAIALYNWRKFHGVPSPRAH